MSWRRAEGSLNAAAISRWAPAWSGLRVLRSALALVVAMCVPAAAEEHVFGVQLHLHGSMSEGHGSMAGHDHAARGLGGAVDVIWWTDHDWRIAGHTYVDGHGFEEGMHRIEQMPVPLTARQLDGREPMPAWALEGGTSDPDSTESVRIGWQRVRTQRDARQAKLQISSKVAREGKKSLHAVLQGRNASWERVALSFGAERRRHIASLASEVRAAISVLPERMDGDVRIVVSFMLSQQPPNLRGRLDYHLSAAGQGASERRATTRVIRGADGQRDARVTVIEVPWVPGSWNDLVFDVSKDAELHGHGGADNSMAEVMVSIEARRGRVEAYLDRFEIERRIVGPPLFERQKEMAAGLGDDALIHYVGQEVSYGAHLNVFGPRVPLADSAAHPHGYTPTQAVALARAHGGISSLNHVFGIANTARAHDIPSTRPRFEDRARRLVELRGYGADLLEVGYRKRGRELKAFVELWDKMSAAGVYMTGVGVSDSHDNDIGWAEGPNNFITWVMAETRDQESLIEALRAGRAFFGDPTRFDGRMDLEAEGGGRMGDVVVASPGPQTVRFLASGLRAGQRVRLVRDGQPIRTLAPTGDEVDVSETIDVRANGFVRFEIVEDGAAVALSNPLYFVLPGHDVPAWRRVGAASGDDG